MVHLFAAKDEGPRIGEWGYAPSTASWIHALALLQGRPVMRPFISHINSSPPAGSRPRAGTSGAERYLRQRQSIVVSDAAIGLQRVRADGARIRGIAATPCRAKAGATWRGAGVKTEVSQHDDQPLWSVVINTRTALVC